MPRDPRPTRTFRCAIDALEPRQLLAATELITNGNFAANSAGWTLTGNFHADAVFTNGNSLPGYAYLSGSDGTTATSNNLVGTLSQTVTIPANANVAQLSFFFKTTTTESADTFDTVSVNIIDAATSATLATPITLSNVTQSTYTKAGWFDLSAYAGKTIILRFTGQTDNTNGTVFRVDDVSLTVDTATVIAPTMVGPGTPTTSGQPTISTLIPQLRWDPVPGAKGYGVLIQQVSPFSTTTVFNSEAGTFASPIKGTTFSSPSPLTGGTYRWMVRAFNAAGVATSYAPPLYFAINTSFNRAVGVDISNNQTVTSWPNIKNNGTTGATTDDTTYIWAKATEGVTFEDLKFGSFVSGARGAGIALGAYHYARPENNTAASEAQHFASIIASNAAFASGTNLAPMLDFESPGAESMTKAVLSKWLNDFCDAFVGLTGIVPIVYTFVSYSSAHLDTSVLRYPLWQAQYPTSAANPTIPITSGNPSGTSPWPSNGWAMWQYTSNRTVSGFTANVDSDVANSDAATFLDAYALPSTTTYTVTGTLFEDADIDGTRDLGEAGIAGRTVFLDADGDGAIDTGERTAVTDATGAYTFTGLPQGNYQVRQVVPGTSLATTAASQSFKLAAGIANVSHDFGSRVIDSTPPTIATSRFDYDVAARTITLVFSEAVNTAQLASTATLANLTTNDTAVPFTIAYNPATFTAVFSPTTLPLVDGDYRLTLPAAAVNDTAGNASAAATVDFFWLAGDIDRNRAVGFSDLVILAQNYNTGTTYAQGDLTGDGSVDFADLVLLAQSYGDSLPAPILAPPPMVTAATKTVTKKKATGDILA